MRQMKIVVIDDEADQAGVNTADVSAEERTRINKLIVELVNLRVESVNYVAYTATPAANFLNEPPGSSLYPEDFIVCLPQSDEHFGPVQIFGLAESGKAALGIVCDVDDDDVDAMIALYGGETNDLPSSLQEALLWFLCCVAAARSADFRKPISMLIHTSSRQAHHAEVEGAVRQFLSKCNADKNKFLKRAATVWAARRGDLAQADFADRFPGYGRLESVTDYPDFEVIRSALTELVSMASAIRLDDSNARTFHRGIHVCVDNCANNGITEENEVRRLFYPEPDSTTKPDFATAFIVIGGGTLSRGLTIENLVSTFFLRGSAQADSLMQMGRWFGYRKGYELLPRIWMPSETREKFEFMTLAEEDLRDDLQRFMYAGAKPSEFGPRVLVHPRASWLKPTAKNRMQSNVPADYDFSGANRQTTIFHDGDDAESIHTHNLLHTEAFLRKRGEGEHSKVGTALVWPGITLDHVVAFLRDFRFHPKAQFFGEIAQFLKWLSENAVEAGYKTWNVVVAGNAPENSHVWELPGGKVGLINRSRIVSNRSDGAVSIGALRDPVDLLADANLDRKEATGNMSNPMVDDLRKRGGVGGVPQLLLYLIDKKSKAGREPRSERSNRADLNAKADIVGVSLWMPGNRVRSQKTFVSHLTVRIPQELAEYGIEVSEKGAGAE